ncbi:hypothetical protein [Lysobacter sp. Root690]|uniref:hypothetical protein n=1 Tax=Lysobacter sp. Root690 TaxID=1736588 RepID=UPI000B0F723B|nr:hypothetical protein [Lysobacter sp. Root690]
MKTTLGVALTPPTAAALIAGACVLAAAFLPTYHACVPDQTRIPPIVANPPALELPKAHAIPAKAAGLKVIQAKPATEVAETEPARAAATPEPGNSARGQR